MNREEGFRRLREQIKQHVKRAEQERIDAELKQYQEKARQVKAHKEKDTWIRKHKPQTKKAARIVWRWYENFISSAEFQEFQAAPRGRLRISQHLQGLTPSAYSERLIVQEQSLSIDTAGTLFVHNHAKYGKSYILREEADLLRFVAWPILVQIARTIETENIWDIIGIS